MKFSHVIAVVQHSKVRLSVRMEITTFQEPVNHRPNVFNCMYVSMWDIPKNRKKATWQRAFLLDALAKLPLCAIVGNKFWVSHANYRLICNLRDQVWHTRQGTFRRKRPLDVRNDPSKGPSICLTGVEQLSATDCCFGTSISPFLLSVSLFTAGSRQVHGSFQHSSCTTVRSVSVYASRSCSTDV